MRKRNRLVSTIITAAPGTAEQPDSSPNTGDNSNMILWLALLLVSGGVIIVAVVLSRKRK